MTTMASGDGEILRARAAAGDASAMAALGRRYLAEGGPAMREAVELTVEAASRGDARALHQVAVFAASGAGLAQDWNSAFEALWRAADAGYAPAARQREVLRGIGRERLLAVPPMRRAVEGKDLFVVQALLEPSLCEWIVERARPRMVPARTYNLESARGVISQDRTNSFTDFNIVDTDILFTVARARIATAVRLPTSGFELTAVLHYLPGERFGAHFDFLDPALPAFRAQIEQQGQRVATALVYLNDDYGGGETDFPKLGFRFKGGKGDALIFSNVRHSGEPDVDMLHAGLPPDRGEKWLLSQFIRAPMAK